MRVWNLIVFCGAPWFGIRQGEAMPYQDQKFDGNEKLKGKLNHKISD